MLWLLSVVCVQLTGICISTGFGSRVYILKKHKIIQYELKFDLQMNGGDSREVLVI